MLGNLTGWHMLIILAVVILLFGAAKLPALAKAVGQSTKIFKSEMKVDAPAAVTETAPAVPNPASHNPASHNPAVQAEAAPVVAVASTPAAPKL